MSRTLDDRVADVERFDPTLVRGNSNDAAAERPAGEENDSAAACRGRAALDHVDVRGGTAPQLQPPRSVRSAGRRRIDGQIVDTRSGVDGSQCEQVPRM